MTQYTDFSNLSNNDLADLLRHVASELDARTQSEKSSKNTSTDTTAPVVDAAHLMATLIKLRESQKISKTAVARHIKRDPNSYRLSESNGSFSISTYCAILQFLGYTIRLDTGENVVQNSSALDLMAQIASERSRRKISLRSFSKSLGREHTSYRLSENNATMSLSLFCAAASALQCPIIIEPIQQDTDTQ